ncbi:solute carrier family 25, member 38 [Kwoniella heveanensis BCC8398]|uniref:Mitochondrial glycine transporter n=1 Tax=Kwoniella heveanensis BCC8398 TaxID=1296120 RepID=A0A1B9GNQ9_9TREE|nr:solute carrier family 25, member 38 [Kwoniella heveanensis BCC8398]
MSLPPPPLPLPIPNAIAGPSSSSSNLSSSSSPSSSKGKTNLKASHHLMSGALSGFSSAVVLQPLDLLKTRLQQASGSASAQEGGLKRRRIRAVVKQVLREDGVPGLWRGTVPTLVRNVPGVAIYFYSLSAIRHKLSSIPYFAVTVPIPASAPSSPSSSLAAGSSSRSKSALTKLSSGGNLMAGAIARTSVGFVLSPITVVKARFESNRYANYHSIPGALLSIYRTNGIRGFFQGFTATAVRDAPYAGMYLVFYEKGKDLIGRIHGIPNAALHSSSGVMAAVFATLLTSPADVVKTRMQVNPADHPSLGKAVARILADRGALGLFSGTSLRISRKAASAAIGWTVYEGLLIFLRDRNGSGIAQPSEQLGRVS